MALVKMEIRSLVVGHDAIASLVVLCTSATTGNDPIQLPIRIGNFEAAAISAAIGEKARSRPLTHDLLANTITRLGATLIGVAIVDVHGPTFFARLMLAATTGAQVDIDCRPSDAIALALRMRVPIYADERVLAATTLPNFTRVEQDNKLAELERFHDFVETLSPDDFTR